MPPLLRNRWLAALLAWAAATGLVSGAYAVWQSAHSQPIHWDFIRDAALIGAAMALITAWRDRGGKE